jgi:formylglycine-generating enzyme required for sulfatase activity
VVGIAAATGLALPFVIGRSSSATGESTNAPRVEPAETKPPPPAVPPVLNRWVAVAPSGSPPLLGLAEDGLPEAVTGFRPRRNVRAPAYAYELQQHEVTFEELEPWLARTGQSFAPPRWVPTDAAARRELPAVGVPWPLAKAYCQSDGVGGNLPTEGEWEYAARGAERRRYPWGDDPVDLARTHAGDKPRPVMTGDQDRTPSGIADLLGNAQEWTVELYRMDDTGADETWVQAQGLTYRTIRGLPPSTTPETIASEGAAYREPLCATGPCPAEGLELIETVGFRCARRLRARLPR